MTELDRMSRRLLAARDLIDDVLIELTQPGPCQHPANQREDLTAMGQTGEHWRCKACGYEYPETKVEAIDGR